MANGFKDHRKLRVNWRQQAKALIDLLRLICVLGMWPKNAQPVLL